ncbi:MULTISPECIES: transcriptional regulator domain-containing protein [unclassified Sphingopyxis]
MSRVSVRQAAVTAIETRRVLPPGSWRDVRAYAGLTGCGARGLAWELLRRDPAYAEAALRAPAARDDDRAALPSAGAAFAARWGLHFRRGSGVQCVRRTPHMDARRRSLGFERATMGTPGAAGGFRNSLAGSECRGRGYGAYRRRRPA